MGEAKRRKAAGLGPRQRQTSDTGALRDYGQLMWRKGARDVVHAILLPTVKIVIPTTTGTTEVVFVCEVDGERVMGTLSTLQAEAAVQGILRRGDLIVEGRLDRETVTGRSGEVYRLLHGTIHDVETYSMRAKHDA